MITSIYFAGPDVFRPDVLDWRSDVIRACSDLGVKALLPCDCQEATAEAIRASNLDMLMSASAVVANLNPFRGVEVDTGTAFEIGYACALGKPAIGYVSELEPMENRVKRLCGPVAAGDEVFRMRDREGYGIESFALPTNLMIAAGIPVIAGSQIDAIKALLGGSRNE